MENESILIKNYEERINLLLISAYQDKDELQESYSAYYKEYGESIEIENIISKFESQINEFFLYGK